MSETNKILSTSEIDKIKADFIEKTKSEAIQNGLWGAIFGGGFPGAGYGFGGPGTQAVSQPSQLFNDLRWYFVSNFRQMLSEAYVEIGLIQTIVDVPVDDGLRGGVEVKSKQLSPDQLEQLRDTMDRQDDLTKVSQALKWNRLFGGAGIMILTNQDPATPLDMASITIDTPLEFRAVDMWELYFDLQNTEGYDAAIQEEKYEYFSYYGTKVHKSRVMKLKGLTAPSFLRPRLRGWGFSVVEAFVRSVNQYLLGTNLIYELLDEAKIDVFGIKNLTNTLLMPNGTNAVAQRIHLANKQKDYQHALVMDAEDNYEQKTLTFSGLADVMKEVRMQVASDLRMPLTKVFGISAAGFNSGEDDIEIYNSMIESTIRGKAKYDILKVCELRCQKLFGFIPDDLSVTFKSLRVLSGEQEETVKEKQFNRLLMSLQAGAISLEQFQSGCNKLNLLGVQLDISDLPEGSDEVGNIPGQDEQQIDEDEERESDRSNLSFMKTPPAQVSKKPSQADQ
jgi:uncharacterized protein